jgi:L-lactate dehydrogenase complex protein LldF
MGRRRTSLGALPIPGPAARWTGARDVPMPPRESFRQWWKHNRANGSTPTVPMAKEDHDGLA